MTPGHCSCAEWGRAARRIAPTAALLLLFAPLRVDAQEPYTWQVESSISYQTGDYGTGEDTDYVYVPFTLKRFLGRGEAALTIPYESIDSEGGRTVVDGQVIESDSSGSGSGLGDVLVKGRFNAVEQHDAWPYVDLVGKLKLPTGDEDKGLGTGEPDFGFGVELMRRLNGPWISFADASYTFIGDPPDVEYDNRTAVDAGFGYQYTPDVLFGTYYEVRTAISDDSEAAHTISCFTNCRLASHVRAHATVDFGVTDGAADFGITGGGSYRF